MKKRFEAILNMLTDVDYIADIGCDHGIVGISALQKNICKKIIATDISDKSLSKAKKQAIAMNIANDKIEFRVGDGLHPIKCSEADAAIIAGMGGPLIEKIIFDSLDIASNMKYIIAMPHSAIEDFRSNITSEFFIADEMLVYEDGHYYIAFKLMPGQDKYNEKEILLGKYLLEKKPPELHDYIKGKLRAARYKCNCMEAAGRSVDDLNQQIKTYEEALLCI